MWLMTFMQLLFSVQGDMFVCVCLHVYDNHTNVLCILKRDGVSLCLSMAKRGAGSHHQTLMTLKCPRFVFIVPPPCTCNINIPH